ncbi:hypothetical protein BFF78_37580 [Streptomyces fodineus]|uniref:Uncharacterized protein n=1 Tax=Streptomyces fodineus TaxID=1904616 RepID=A0A1D7YKD3_9ACTN|nr:hypothetical protein BFF78_37580 [Streptomyces fodineus]
MAFFVGTIEPAGVLHDKLGLSAVSGWIAGLNPDNVGCIVVGLLVVVWAVAIAHWRLAKVEERRRARTADAG